MAITSLVYYVGMAKDFEGLLSFIPLHLQIFKKFFQAYASSNFGLI